MRLVDTDAARPYLYEHLDDCNMIAAQNALDEMPTIDNKIKGYADLKKALINEAWMLHQRIEIEQMLNKNDTFMLSSPLLIQTIYAHSALCRVMEQCGIFEEYQEMFLKAKESGDVNG